MKVLATVAGLNVFYPHFGHYPVVYHFQPLISHKQSCSSCAVQVEIFVLFMGSSYMDSVSNSESARYLHTILAVPGDYSCYIFDWFKLPTSIFGEVNPSPQEPISSREKSISNQYPFFSHPVALSCMQDQFPQPSPTLPRQIQIGSSARSTLISV
jgi:hypothetical protein